MSIVTLRSGMTFVLVILNSMMYKNSLKLENSPSKHIEVREITIQMITLTFGIVSEKEFCSEFSFSVFSYLFSLVRVFDIDSAFLNFLKNMNIENTKTEKEEQKKPENRFFTSPETRLFVGSF